MKPARLKNLQSLRGVAALLVVFYHLGKVELKYGRGTPLLPDFMAIGIAGVDLFFVISGFIMVMITADTARNFQTFKGFLYKRLTRIYPLYWVFSGMVLVVYWWQPTWVNSSQGGKVDILASFLLLPQQQLPLLMVGWTLVHELYFYIVIAGMLLVVRRSRFGVALALWATLPILNLWLNAGHHSLWRLIAHPLTLEFIAGGFVARFYRRGWRFTHHNAIGALTAVLALVAGYGVFQNLYGRLEPGDWERVFLFGGPAVLMVHSLMALERDNRRHLPRWLVAVGNASYSIYLSHILVLSAVGRFWVAMGWHTHGGNAPMLICMLAATLAFGLLSFHYIEKPLLQLCRRS